MGISHMLAGLLMLLAPCAVFVFSVPFSRRLRPRLRKTYQIVGGLLVFLGSGTSFYLASYSGDQGGIAAFFLQMAVIVTYGVFSISLVILNWILNVRESGRIQS